MVKGITAFVVGSLVLALCLAVQHGEATCSTTAVGTVILNNCPLESHDLADNSTLVINFVNTTLDLPTTTLQTKAFQMDGHPVRIPMGVIYIPKGVNATVILNNEAEQVTNLHTHGLHVQGGLNSDGTTSDDVAVEIQPGTQQVYNYYIPGDHAGGTHWIHAHVHMRTEIQVLGGALGLLVVKDEPTGLEVPEQILDAPTFEVIMAHFNPNRFTNALNNAGYSMTPSVNVPFYLVNGFSNPILQIEQGRWTRIRSLHASPSDPLFILLPSSTPNCTFVLLAKDGVYLPSGPRVIAGGSTIFYTHASRVDYLVKCDGAVGSKVQLRTNYASQPAPVVGGPPNPTQDLNVFQLSIVARSANVQADSWFPSFTPCLPAYLNDMTGLSASQIKAPLTFQLRGPAPPPAVGDTLNGQQFSSFGPSAAIFNLTIGSVYDVTVDGINHPLHVHVNPMQYTADSVNGWHKAGDFVDVMLGTTQPFPSLRTRIDQDLGLIVVHCHILGHEDGGLMGVMYAYPDESIPSTLGIRASEVWGQNGQQCSSKVVLAGANGFTAAPTSHGDASFPRSPSVSVAFTFLIANALLVISSSVV